MPEKSTGPRKAGAKKAAGGDELTLTFTVDGHPYRIDGYPSHRHERALYQQAKLTFPQLMAGLLEDGLTPPFVLAGFVFLAKLQAGTPEPYDDIADAITYDTPVTYGTAEDDAVGEAQGSD